MDGAEVTPFAAPFTTMLVCTRVGVDPVTGNIWQLQGTRGMVNVGTIAAPPVNTVAPVVSGTLTHGSTLTCTSGTWNSAVSYTYQWISGVNSVQGPGSLATYVTTSGDVGNMIYCIVTALNSIGTPSGPVNSNAVGPIT